MVLRTWKGKYNTQELEVFTNLETHIQDIQEIQAHLDRINLTSKAVKSYSDTDMSQETIMGYAARVCVYLVTSVFFHFFFNMFI
jgi:SET and MYND domain-containing protein